MESIDLHNTVTAPYVQDNHIFCYQNQVLLGTSLAVQWLRLHTSTSGVTGSIPGEGTKIPHAARHGQKRKKIGTFERLKVAINNQSR